MIKLVLPPIILALILYLVYEFYKFSSPEEKGKFLKGAVKTVFFLSVACILLFVFVILF